MNQYTELKGDMLDEHLSNFIIEHLSYSSVRSFQRNELAYSRHYIYKIYDPSGASALGGSAYHKAVEAYFNCLKSGATLPNLAELSEVGFNYIAFKPDKDLKTGKTHRTVEEVRAAASDNFRKLIINFMSEADAYLDDIEKVLFVEERFEAFITLSDWDCPLPFVCVADLIYLNKKGELCITDHKGKGKYTDPEDAVMTCSSQAVVNAKVLEAAAEFDERLTELKGKKVKHFRYLENKVAKNRDCTRQIHALPIPLDDATLPVTELLLAEAARRVVEASQNPDYEYLPNPDDNFEQAKDLFDFWVKTKTDYYDDWEKLSPNQKKILAGRKTKNQMVGYSKIKKIRADSFENKAKQFVSINYSTMDLNSDKKIENTLRLLGKPARVAEIIEGYAADTYLLEAGAGVSIKSVMAGKMDIAAAVGAENVLIPERLVTKGGRAFIAVDVPRDKKLRRFADKPKFEEGDSIPLGISNMGEIIGWDFQEPSSPHLLVAGSTGSGKSVTLKNLITEAEKRGYNTLILDPKNEFKGITDQLAIEEAIRDSVQVMNNCYKSKEKIKMMILIDEVSDLFANEQKKADKVAYTWDMNLNKTENERARAAMQADADDKFKTLSENILLLAQKARAAGIHLVLASQRFSTKIMSGDIKANFAARLAMTCASATDSRVMLDDDSAADLCGNGDAIFVAPQLRNPVRIQCFK